MKDEVNNSADKTDDKTVAQPAGPSKLKRLMPVMLFALGGLTLLAGVVAATLYLAGSKADKAVASEKTSDSTTVVQNSVSPLQKKSSPEVTADDKVAAMDSLEAAADSAEAASALLQNIALMNDSHADSTAIQPVNPEDSAQAETWLSTEKQKLDTRAAELDAREKDIQKKDYEISQKILRIEQTSSDRITNLAKLYDGMDADAVAKIFANLDDETVVSLIPRMKQKNASAVMALMPPPRAAKLSKQIITLASE